MLKPIEKKEMKEYLVKSQDGKWRLETDLVGDPADEAIEIPKGSVKATLCNDFLIFWKDDYLGLSKKNGDTDFTFDEKEDYGFVEYMDINDDAILIWQREPIENVEIMKEYLIPNDGNYKYQKAYPITAWKQWIEIPEGANGYYQYTEDDVDNTFFLKKIGDTYCFANKDNDYSWEWYAGEMKGHEFVLWQRESPNDKLASAEQYRQAEVLPFIDDEPKNVDLASGCDLDELAKEYGFRDRDMGESCLCYRESLKIFIARHKSREWDLSDYDFAESDAFIESNVEQDNVNNPSHYADGEIECIDAIESSMTHEAFCGYLKGNIQKYIWRYEKKGGIESLKKGQWYLSRLIEVEDEKTK